MSEEKDNLQIWNRFADIDAKFTKSITGKDYKGTSPNAHYVIQCLTDLFGPVGQGFGWRVVAENIDHFGETAIHWCRIEFWHTDRANTFESYGQTKMAYMTRGENPYLKVDEDAPKKSLTDAITKAAAQVGIASSIFLGRWDDNKYVQEVNTSYREAEKKAKPEPTSADKAKRFMGNISKARDIAALANWMADEKRLSILATLDAEDRAHVDAAAETRKEELSNADLGGELAEGAP